MDSERDDPALLARVLGAMLVFAGATTAVAWSLAIATGESTPGVLVWGVLLGVLPILAVAWALRSKSTIVIELAGWACVPVLLALGIGQPGAGPVVTLAGVYVAGGILLTSARLVLAHRTHV